MTETTPEAAQLTADAVLFGERESELFVLLVRRGWPPFEGCWALPGGFVDPGEGTEDTAHRELAEETGLRVGSLRLVGVYAQPGRDPRGRFVSFAYTCRLAHLPHPAAGDDAADACWLPVGQALRGPAAFDHADIIRDALALIRLPHHNPAPGAD